MNDATRKKIVLIDAEGLLVSGDAVADRGPAQLVHPVSGSVFMRGERKAPEQQKTLSENEYLEQLDGGDSYLLARWTWGYKELSGNAEQTELLPYYRFMFQAPDAEKTRDNPPRMIEVSALGEKS